MAFLVRCPACRCPKRVDFLKRPIRCARCDDLITVVTAYEMRNPGPTPMPMFVLVPYELFIGGERMIWPWDVNMVPVNA